MPTMYKACERTMTVKKKNVLRTEGEYLIIECEGGYDNSKKVPRVSAMHVYYPSWNEAYRYLTSVIQTKLEICRSELKSLIDHQTRLEDLIDPSTEQTIMKLSPIC